MKYFVLLQIRKGSLQGGIVVGKPKKKLSWIVSVNESDSEDFWGDFWFTGGKNVFDTLREAQILLLKSVLIFDL